MSQYDKADLIPEFCGAMFMLVGALYFHHFVTLQSRLFKTPSPSKEAVLMIRIGAGLIAIVLVFIMLQ